MKGLYLLFRHGERLDGMNVTTEEKQATKVINPLDIPLSIIGKEQAFYSGKFFTTWLKEHGLEIGELKLYSSPYLRCLQTMEGVIRGLDYQESKEVTVREELSEMQIGSYGDSAKIDDLVINTFP